MQVSVGSALKYNSEDCICTRIEQRNATFFAKQDSQTMKSELSAAGNCRYLSSELDEFLEGDIITIECEWMELTAPGKNMFFVYTTYRARKEQIKDDAEGTKAADQETRGEQAQDVGERAQSGEGVGEEGVGE